jgi:hypothetical protein
MAGMTHPSHLSILLLFSAAAMISLHRATADDSAGIEFFERKIRPILVNHCYECHSHAAKKHKGKLYLDSRAGIRTGGESGPAVVPGKPAESWLLKAVRHQSEDLKMPPKGKLPASVIADLEAWIKMGAPDPRDKAPVKIAESSWEEILKKRRHWWSLQPVRKSAIPEVKNAGWSKQPVDRFILARLEQAGLKPGPKADKRTLVRRLSLVLTGLPPTPDLVNGFLLDDSPRAYENLVDRLLDSPHFGERWARHWLDVVRFAETHGNEWNYEVHHAWRYRDYLIRAFNQDVPYDRFVAEHIAGDLLPPRWNRKEKFNESPIGTAFFRFGEVNHDDCLEFRQIGYDLVDNQLDTLTKAFQATTVACARCHDHKIDAISMKDYYALLGILRSSRQVTHTIDAVDVNEPLIHQMRELKKQIRQEQARLWLKEVSGLNKRFEASVAGKAPLESPLYPWLAMRSRASAGFPEAWQKLQEQLKTEAQQRADFNAKNCVSFLDFSHLNGWQVSGQGLRGGASANGDFAVAGAGDSVLTGIYPAGFFTHVVSEKLNGVLRSPILNGNKKYISFHVVGNKTSAVRLVSNNCQLNYVNYQALTKNEFTWKKFAIPMEAGALGTYAELMTKFDNPKFPDQLGTLGGDTYNARVPWAEAAKDPNSYFGVTRVVLHDCAETPRAELSHLLRLFAGKAPRDLAELGAIYEQAARSAINAWEQGKATADDVIWLDWFVRNGLVTNSRKATPQVEKLVDQYRALEKQLALPRIVAGLADAETGFDQPLLARGDFRKPGELVPRRYLEVLDQPLRLLPDRVKGSGRLELAKRIASPDNPLTARVMVNRIWHHLFGSGIVRTVDDFGRVGELPSHPELLDYLAARFVEEGWSIKKLIRSLVLTQTFQMTSRADAASTKVDPENRLLHHFPARRFEAEAIRDAILFASGRLDLQMFGPSIDPYREGANTDRRLFPGPLDGNGRRSIYIKVNLMEGPKFLGAFNFPGGKVTQGRRDVTNVPAQALALLNDPFVLQQADFWAKRLVARKDAAVADRIEHMFQIALGRPADKEEREQFARAVVKLAELHEVPTERILSSQIVWHDVAHAMFNLKEFIYIW